MSDANSTQWQDSNKRFWKVKDNSKRGFMFIDPNEIEALYYDTDDEFNIGLKSGESYFCTEEEAERVLAWAQRNSTETPLVEQTARAYDSETWR